MDSSLSKNEAPLTSLQNIPFPSTKVYVCFLPSDMTENVLQKMFERFGKILSLKLLKRKDGFTYSHIIYEKIQQAKMAIKTMNRLQMQDKILKVNFAAQVEKKSKVKQTDELVPEGKKQEFKSFAELLFQKMPSKKKNKKTKKQNKQMKDGQKIENKAIVQPLPIQIQKETKQTKKSIIREQIKKQTSIKNIKISEQVQKIEKYQVKLVVDQQDTQAEWSQDFDPADLKKKPFSSFIL